MKYTTRKTAEVGSLAAAEIKATMEGQEPPLGMKEAADMIGISYETLRSVVNNSRVPTAGVIFGLARVMNLDQKWVDKVLKMRQEDMLQKKVNKALSGTDDLDNLVTILGALNKDQVAELRKKAMSLAVANRGKK